MTEQLTYTDPALLGSVTITETPKAGVLTTGYGPLIPTCYMLHYAGQKRRVYVMNYGNAGTPYVMVKGEQHILDVETEHAIYAAREEQ